MDPISLSKAARILGVEWKTLKKWVKQGKVRPKQTIQYEEFLFDAQDIIRIKERMVRQGPGKSYIF